MCERHSINVAIIKNKAWYKQEAESNFDC